MLLFACKPSDFDFFFKNSVLISELLDDHQNAPKAKEGEAADLCREMERLSTAGKTTAEEISQLTVDL